jgi:hypothetical protein
MESTTMKIDVVEKRSEELVQRIIGRSSMEKSE